ncbi:PRORS1 [Auxenochlorella protothecoides x Auxenochlorella symbiontica]|uniref:proline--tRNA ligase n=2 Tax=Auxenochlorella protothecoides TaxID=3075 RepID=A0A1D1ZN54_AUXPR
MSVVLSSIRLGPQHAFRAPRTRLVSVLRAPARSLSAASAQPASPAKDSKRSGPASEQSVTPLSEDFSRWYLDVIREAQLADYGPVRGTMVIRPYGYALWERLQSWLDAALKEHGVQNAYFPQLIPMSFFEREAEHVEGFAPELAIVTRGGGKELEEPLALRPTSETIINSMFAKWVQSHRDLPMRLNQWANVHRWEMRTRPFVRTLEFLWQEGHTAHATPEEARAEAMAMLEVYREFAVTQAAMPVIAGRKSRIEQFAGANATFTIEAMMRDGRALQAGTTHDLGDNFSRAFGTQFSDAGGRLRHAHQASFGMSTRMVGGVVMSHGDDTGLRLPPRMAPLQVVLVPVAARGAAAAAVLAAVDAALVALRATGVRAQADVGTEKSPGWKFSHWEMKGVPLRIEIGPRDVASGTCAIARRDRPGKEGKEFGVPLAPELLVQEVLKRLDEVQAELLERATRFRDEHILDVSSHSQFLEVIEQGKWARGWWAGSDEQEVALKEESGATLRCFPLEQPGGGGTCFLTGKPADQVALFAKAY